MRQRTSDELRAVVRADDDTTFAAVRRGANAPSVMYDRPIDRSRYSRRIHAGTEPKRAIKGKQ